MPPPGINIPMKAGIKPIRDAFKEFHKQQKKLWKERQQQMRLEEKHHKFEMDAVKIQSKEEQKAIRKMGDGIKKINREKDQERKKTERFESKQARINEKERRQQKTHVDKMNREMKRGPLRRFAGFAGRSLAFAGGGLVGLAAGAAIKGYQNYMQYQRSLGASIGMGGGLERDAWRSAGGRGGNLGFNVAERASLMPQMGRAAGVRSPRQMMEAMRSTAMTSGEVGEIFSTLRAGGANFSGTATVLNNRGQQVDRQVRGRGGEQFAKLITSGMTAGFNKSELPKYFSGINRLMQRQMQISANDVNAKDFAGLASRLAMSGQSGMMRGRGMNVLSALQQSILAPQGEQNMAFMQRAMGFGTPGGRNDYFQAEMQREKGLDETNMQRIMRQLESEYGFEGEARGARLKLRELTGGKVGLEQGKALIDVYKSSQSQEEKLEKTKQIIEETKSLEEQAYESMKRAGTSLGRIAWKFDESVGIGADSKEILEAIEDAQLKLTKFMISVLKEIRDILKTVADFVKRIWESLPGVKDTRTAIESGALASERKKIEKKARRATSLDEKIKLYTKARDLATAQLKSTNVEGEDPKHVALAVEGKRQTGVEMDRRLKFFQKMKKMGLKPTREDQQALEDIIRGSYSGVGQETGDWRDLKQNISRRTQDYLRTRTKDKAAAQEVQELERKKNERQERQERQRKKNENKEPGPKSASLTPGESNVNIHGIFELRGGGVGQARPIIHTRDDSDHA